MTMGQMQFKAFSRESLQEFAIGVDRGNKLLRRQRALGLLRQVLKRRRISHRQISQDLAIQLHSALLQTVDELAVAHAVKAGGGADAHNPYGAELALLL